MVIEAGVVAGYVIAWALRKTRRVGSRLDAEVDATVDAGLERLHTLVAAKLGALPALDDVTEDAAGDASRVSEPLQLALTAAAHEDDNFARTVNELVTLLRAAEKAAGTQVVSGNARVFTGDAHPRADGDGIAIGQVGGDIHMDRLRALRQQPDPFKPGQSRP
ncbi:hypothetical protein OIE50_50795 [Streptomyces canus]|uniref:hypothetical protein n=1 Tax=Streptomyces canus TaxID=58343 RepID=UPI003243EA23